MAIKSKKELGVEKLTALADKGYWNDEELKKCEEENITAIVANSKEQGNKGYKKSDFKYNKEQDYYVCPNGKILHRTGKKEVKYVNRKACKECTNRDKCTKNKSGRAIRVSETEE